MKTIGILGGMSAASTALYYQRLNAKARERLGGLHQAELLIRSLDFAVIEEMQEKGDWDAAGALLHREAQMLQDGGAKLLILATNTMHKVAERMTLDLSIPFLHIAEATAAAILQGGHKRPGVLATAYTMEQDFYTGKLREAGLEPLVPEAEDRAEVHRIIYEELCHDIVRDDSRARLVEIAGRLGAAGADCLILGCTEVGMALTAENAPLPVYDTTLIHCDTALEAALS